MNRLKLVFQTSLFLTFLCLLLSIGLFFSSYLERNLFTNDGDALQYIFIVNDHKDSEYCNIVSSLIFASLVLIGLVFIYKFFYVIFINHFDQSKIDVKHRNIVCSVLLGMAFILLLSTVFIISFSKKNIYFNNTDMHTIITSSENQSTSEDVKSKYYYGPAFYILIVLVIMCFITFLNETIGCLTCKIN